MPLGHILVIAINPDLRRSLAFALETEGYFVETDREIPSQDRLASCDAIVLDHRAIRQEPLEQTVRIGHAEVPVILLASRPQDWLAHNAFRTIRTPLMGSVLTDAVADAMAAGGRNSPK